eukprot:COSAG02_NODE_25534_length_655_cov_0.527828_2_plen_142_part_01
MCVTGPTDDQQPKSILLHQMFVDKIDSCGLDVVSVVKVLDCISVDTSCPSQSFQLLDTHRFQSSCIRWIARPRGLGCALFTTILSCVGCRLCASDTRWYRCCYHFWCSCRAGSGCGCSFFFKQKTAYEISECDWSSDVCSSD